MTPPAASPYSSSFYSSFAGGSRSSADAVLPVLNGWMKAPTSSVLDVGCGIGTWLAAWQALDVTDVRGVDGDYVNRSALLIDESQFLAHDLTTPLDLGRTFDVAQCLEVAEHLPHESSQTLVDSLCRHADVVLFSAAAPSQPGNHHINCQWPSYWVERFALRGYRAFDAFRPQLWEDERVDYWYRQNCWLFVAEGAVANRLSGTPESPLPMDLAHPRMVDEVLRDAAAVKGLRTEVRSAMTAASRVSRAASQAARRKLRSS
jgi:SAM-dependent methyltransferase